MPWRAIKLQRLDMRHRRSLGQAGHFGDCGARTEVEEHAVSFDSFCATIAQLDFHRATSDESRNAINQFRAAGFGVISVYLTQFSDHRAFSPLNSRHIDAQRISFEPELHAAPGQGDYLGGPDDVLAWQAGDVGTGATEQPALYNYRSTTAIAGPCGKFTSDSAADNQVVILLNVSHLIRLPDRTSREIGFAESRLGRGRRGSCSSRKCSARRSRPSRRSRRHSALRLERARGLRRRVRHAGRRCYARV